MIGAAPKSDHLERQACTRFRSINNGLTLELIYGVPFSLNAVADRQPRPQDGI